MSLKTITDEGKREWFEQFIMSETITSSRSKKSIAAMEEFLDTYAAKVAKEVKTMLQEAAAKAAHCKQCEEWTAEKVEKAFQTFLGKV